MGRLRRVRRVWSVLAPTAAGLVAVMAVGLLGVAPASAAGNGKFSIAPVSTGSTTRTVFTPVLSPGVPVGDKVVVINETTQPMTLQLYAADAYTSRDGQFVVKPDFQPKRAMGAWIHLPVSHVTVPAKSGDVVPFTYDPPGNVSPGDYAGGIIAEQAHGTVSRKGPLGLQALEAVGTAVYGRVQGALHPRLAVTSVDLAVGRPVLSQFGGSVDATVTYSVTNTGNETLSPEVTVSLAPLVGGGPAPQRVHLPPILPGSTVTFAKTFHGVVPFGHLSATVTAQALGASATGTGSAVVTPWALVALVVLVVLALLVRRYRRRARRRSGVAGPSGGTTPPSGNGHRPGGGSSGDGSGEPLTVDAGVKGSGSP